MKINQKNINIEYNSQEDLLARLQEIEQEKRHIRTPEELEQLEQEILGLTNQIAAIVLQKKVQESLDSEEQKKDETEFIKNCPKRMKSEGLKHVKGPGKNALSQLNSSVLAWY